MQRADTVTALGGLSGEVEGKAWDCAAQECEVEL